MKKSQIKHLHIGDYIYEHIDCCYKITKFYPSGIQIYQEWSTDFGNMHQYSFITYEDLYNNYKSWHVIN